jgi:uncharacterized membrane protein
MTLPYETLHDINKSTNSGMQMTLKAAIANQLHDGEKARHSITINRKHEDVYAFFRDFKNLPLFMKNLVQVDVLSAKRSHWVVEMKKELSDIRLQWDAEIITEVPGEMISWRSIGKSDVQQAGSVWFMNAPGDRGCVVRLHMAYTLPGGKLSELAAKLFGEDPDTLIMTNLRRLKSYLECGEIPTTQGQPSGREEEMI